MLHTIIFDEMDAICKSRGSVRDGTGVSDSIVNQLLEDRRRRPLNNILVIGMTNRKDMIDEAILRPGRLELHVEIGLPDEKGRLQILDIKTASMRKAGRLQRDAVDALPELAGRTKNFSGAELEGLVKSAASYALRRCRCCWRQCDRRTITEGRETRILIMRWIRARPAPRLGPKLRHWNLSIGMASWISAARSEKSMMLCDDSWNKLGHQPRRR